MLGVSLEPLVYTNRAALVAMPCPAAGFSSCGSAASRPARRTVSQAPCSALPPSRRSAALLNTFPWYEDRVLQLPCGKSGGERRYSVHKSVESVNFCSKPVLGYLMNACVQSGLT